MAKAQLQSTPDVTWVLQSPRRGFINIKDIAPSLV